MVNESAEDAAHGAPTTTAAAATTFAAAVRALRLRAGLSLNELARRTGIDPAYLHRIEPRGRPQPTIPRRPVVLALGHALGLGSLQLDDLLARAGYCPEAVLLLGGWDRTLAEVAVVLSQPNLPDHAKAEFRDVLHILANRWAAPSRSGEPAG